MLLIRVWFITHVKEKLYSIIIGGKSYSILHICIFYKSCFFNFRIKGFWKTLSAFSENAFSCNFLQLFYTLFATFLRLFSHHVGKAVFRMQLFATFDIF
jgi:hypothetical protein